MMHDNQESKHLQILIKHQLEIIVGFILPPHLRLTFQSPLTT